jgi:hypothetical protein
LFIDEDCCCGKGEITEGGVHAEEEGLGRAVGEEDERPRTERRRGTYAVLE